MPYQNEFEATSEHLTVVYEKLDEIKEELKLGFEKVDNRFRGLEDELKNKIRSLELDNKRTHIELKEIKGMLFEILKHSKEQA